MSVTSHEQSALERLAAARLRDAQPDELLDLADAAIEQATADEDGLTLELIAAELDSAAAAHPERRDGLRVAAARARAAAPPSPSPSPPVATAPEPAKRAGVEITTFAAWGSRFLAWLIDWAILIGAVALAANMVGRDGSIVLILGAFAYFAYLNGQGKTLGKWLFRIKVVDATTHQPIGTGRGVVRELVRVALAVPTLGIGLIIDGLRPLWNENHRSVHDAAVNSIVIHTGVTVVRPTTTRTTPGEGA